MFKNTMSHRNTLTCNSVEPAAKRLSLKSISNLIVALVAAFAVVFGVSTTQAQASELYVEHKQVFENVVFTEVDEDSLLVTMNGQDYLIHLDAEGDPVSVDSSEGVSVDDDLGFSGISTFAKKEHPACTIALQVAQTLHNGGWAAAIALAVASGGLGAIILAILYGAGVNGFFVWLKSNC